MAVSGTAVVVSAPLEPSTIPAISLAGAICRWRRCGCAMVRPSWTRASSRICATRWLALPAALDDLTDVNVPSPSDGDVLTWDDGAGEWVSAPAGATFSGDAFDVPYTPTTGGDWTEGAPSDVGGALDTLAARSPGSGSAAHVQIAKTTLASSQASITFSSIPTSYDYLLVRYHARSDRASNNEDNIDMYANGESATTNYRYQSLYATSSSPVAAAGTGQTVGRITGSTANADEFAEGVVEIMQYQSAHWKNARGLAGMAAHPNIYSYGWTWESTSAITSLTFKPSSTNNFVSGTIIELIGVKYG